ncbi:MAG: peptidylprolyl isomerase [Maricaulaceae bacterium]
MMKKISMIALASLMLTSQSVAQDSSEATLFEAPDSAWRVVDLENLMLIDTDYGRIGVELYPEISPKHVEQIKTLTRAAFYDGIVFHRVINGFMNQTGDPTGTGTGDSGLPNIPAEFSFQRDPTKIPVEVIHERLVNPHSSPRRRLGAGFYKNLPIATEPAAQAFWKKSGTVDSIGLHCKGVTSMARAGSPDSGNSQFFLMRSPRGSSSEGLNGQYSIWGRAVMGIDIVDKIRVGVNGETAGFTPDKMNKARIAADLDGSEVPQIKVLKTQGADYKRFLATQKKLDGTYKDICDIEIPIQIKTP